MFVWAKGRAGKMYLAQVGLLARVDPEVGVEVALADEHLVADDAGVLPVVHAGVYLLVALAEALGDEAPAAYLAGVGLDAHVPVLVVQQGLLRLEVLAAGRAGVGLEVRVDALVDDQVALALEALAAGRAIEVELAGVGGRVLGEPDLTAEGLLAEDALERLLARVLAHVLLQFADSCFTLLVYEAA
jgi:hypothetical protein